ncbi:hypothetical protein NPIL_242671 [Nephila pilipes]|uniref:Uncharacterized protein n=1 Tax=Nephila pilipes TaxID=299642 RepID=A0A8X6PQX8_NEPPI|nr:hypothetical protein NPIL_242671 [Nephila pilipes]
MVCWRSGFAMPYHAALACSAGFAPLLYARLPQIARFITCTMLDGFSLRCSRIVSSGSGSREEGFLAMVAHDGKKPTITFAPSYWPIQVIFFTLEKKKKSGKYL